MAQDTSGKPILFSEEFYKKYNIKYPIIQAPMAGGASCPLLVAAVAQEGCIGFLAGGYLNSLELEKQIIDTKKLTAKIFGVNLFIYDKIKVKNVLKPQNITVLEKEFGIHKNKTYTDIILDEELEQKINIILKHEIKIVSFTFGLPEKKYLEKLRKNNIYLIGNCTNIIEAKIIESEYLDALVAQGVEAGGHRSSFLNHNINDEIGLFSLLEEFTSTISIPIIAAGGIVSGKGIAAARLLGAKAVQLGTAFLLTEESGIPKSYKEVLLNCHAHETVFTDKISGKKARGKLNRLIVQLNSKKSQKLNFPLQNLMTKEIRSFAGKNNLVDYMSLWCGQSIWKIKQIKSVSKLVNDLYFEYNEALNEIKKI